MEFENSLPHSQAHATCPCPEPGGLVHAPSFHVLNIHFNIILPCTPGSFKFSPSLSFPAETLYPALFSLICAVLTSDI
jgi:hypothetical protein